MTPALRITLLLALTAALGAGALSADARRPAVAADEILVYKTPTCGCCGKWVDHMKANGFTATVKDTVTVMPIKQRLGVPPSMASCHTTVVNGYVVEGHVPASTVRKLLKERPAIVGIAAPGMPAGSPGMEGPVSQRYDVVTFDRSGHSRVYTSH